MSQTLTFSLVQTNIIWENKNANLAHYSAILEADTQKKEIVILPEMFSTGFSMKPHGLAEPMDGPTIGWMKTTAAMHGIILAGSLIIEEDGAYYNRFIWMQPDGRYYHYDKRHLFGFSGEDQHYSAGDKKLLLQVKGWKIFPLICYDLRFPVWARNVEAEYDVLLYVANWPERRSLAWQTLLTARAIENQAFVIGVNRIGEDGNGHNYNGQSIVHDPLGNALLSPGSSPGIYTITLDKSMLETTRQQLPFLKDADRFLML